MTLPLPSFSLPRDTGIFFLSSDGVDYLMFTDILQALATMFVSLPVHMVDNQAVVKIFYYAHILYTG